MNRVIMLYTRQLFWEVRSWLQSGTLALWNHLTYHDIGGVSLNDKQSALYEVWYGQYWGIHQSCFQLVKWRPLSLSPCLLIMWFNQLSKGYSNVSIASYKLAIIIDKAKELLNLFLGLRLRLLVNSCYFLRISTDTLYWYNIPKVIDWAQAKGTLQLLSTELVLLKLL